MRQEQDNRLYADELKRLYVDELKRLLSIATSPPLNWKKSRVAKELGLHASNITKYNQNKPPSLTVLKLLSILLRTPLKLGLKTTGWTPIHEMHDATSNDEQHLLQVLATMKADLRARLVRSFVEIATAAAGPVSYATLGRKRTENAAATDAATEVAHSQALSVVSESTHGPVGEAASITAPPGATSSRKRKRASGPQDEPLHLQNNGAESPKQTPGNAPKDRAGRTP